jgi:hypothetical protein
VSKGVTSKPRRCLSHRPVSFSGAYSHESISSRVALCLPSIVPLILPPTLSCVEFSKDMLVSTMALSTSIVLSLLYAQLVRSQTTTYLPPPPLYSDGRFISPDTSGTQIFSEGSTMNVSWTTKYSSVHLYLLSGTDYDNPRTCLCEYHQLSGASGISFLIVPQSAPQLPFGSGT